MNMVCLLRNEGLPSFRLRASSCIVYSQKVERRCLATFRKRCGHSRKDGFPDFCCVHIGRESRVSLGLSLSMDFLKPHTLQYW